MPPVTRHKLLLAAAIASGIAALSAQSPQTPPPAGRGAAQKPILPAAVTVLAAKPDVYVGGMVSLTAAVHQNHGPTSFSIVQGRASVPPATEVLVVAPVLTAPVEPGAYVTVIGEVVRFDPADLATRMKGAAPAFDAETIAKYRGRPVIIATSVINAAMTDLAKRLPPPMSEEELALSRLMKLVGPGFNALRQAATATNAADVGAQAAALHKAFGETAAFWKTKTHPDALQWNEDARRESEAIRAAAAKGDWDAVKTAVPKLQQTCASCHNQYRERLDDGTYRFKPR